MSELIKGYKVVRDNMNAVGGNKQYETEHLYVEDVEPEVASRGMHFSATLHNLFEVYHVLGKKIVEVAAYGDVDYGQHLMSTNKMFVLNVLDENDINTILQSEGEEYYDTFYGIKEGVDSNGEPKFRDIKTDENGVIISYNVNGEEDHVLTPKAEEDPASDIVHLILSLTAEDSDLDKLSQVFQEELEALNKQKEEWDKMSELLASSNNVKSWSEMTPEQRALFKKHHPEIAGFSDDFLKKVHMVVGGAEL